MNLQIKKLNSSEIDQFIELIKVFEDVFELKDFKLPPKIHLQQLLNKDSFLVFVALTESKVIAGLTAYTMDQYVSELPLVYIYDLAVVKAFQRQGIGSKLISTLNDYCKEIGVGEVFVQADEADDYALEFYRSTGASSEKVVHFTYALNS